MYRSAADLPSSSATCLVLTCDCMGSRRKGGECKWFSTLHHYYKLITRMSCWWSKWWLENYLILADIVVKLNDGLWQLHHGMYEPWWTTYGNTRPECIAALVSHELVRYHVDSTKWDRGRIIIQHVFVECAVILRLNYFGFLITFIIRNGRFTLLNKSLVICAQVSVIWIQFPIPPKAAFSLEQYTDVRWVSPHFGLIWWYAVQWCDFSHSLYRQMMRVQGVKMGTPDLDL